MTQTITATGQSGTKYTYTSYPIGTKFTEAAGNYMFAYQPQYGQSWTALYIGQTNNFAARFNNHEKLDMAIKRGATHILVRLNGNQQARLNEEVDLIASHKPVCNDLLK